MPRTNRPLYEPDSILHVYSRGVAQHDIFLDDKDRKVFRAFMREALRARDVGLLAYCLMGNHFHLLITVGQEPVWRAVHRMLMRYSAYFNRKYERVGHLFQGRFQSILCRNDAYLLHLIAYIHKNPVRAKMVGTPGDWPWSSHGEYASGSDVYVQLERLGRCTGLTPSEIRARYADRLSAGKDMLPLAVLAAQAAGINGIPVDRLLSGGTQAGCVRARRLLINLAVSEGYTLTDIATLLGCSVSALSQLRKSADSNKECPTA